MAAAPALVGVAAVAVLAPQATPVLAATTSGTSTSAHEATAPDTTGLPGPASVELLAASKAANTPVAAVTTAAEASSTKYKVRSGDSLSSIAQHFYHKASAWPVLYYNNRKELRWADVITPGEVLNIPPDPTHIPRPPGELGPGYTPKHASSTTAAPAQTHTPTTTVDSYSGTWPGGAFGACVVERESGGNPDIWNASGHWGLYQFSAGTWAAYGGSPALFGSASVAEQEAVFMTALSEGGESNWAPYDGC